jgi:YegS/Rv2252/BmrU family lipid kinase
MTDTVMVIVNPTSGPRGDRTGHRRRAIAEAALAAHRAHGAVHVTEGPGHALELARAAVAAGATLVCAWGGDGTLNEVARAVAGTGTALGVVPAGSGNGLARELGLPWDPAQALQVALGPRERVIDVGDADGRLFVNVAGIGFDAEVAARFNRRPGGRRGFWPYLGIGIRAVLRYRPLTYTIRAGGETWQAPALAVVCANARQYGGGAVVAPQARLDDGQLDLVVVAPRPPLQALWDGRHLLRGTFDRAPGVRSARVTEVEIAGPEPLLVHVDGEAVAGGPAVTVRIRPGGLRVRVP